MCTARRNSFQSFFFFFFFFFFTSRHFFSLSFVLHILPVTSKSRLLQMPFLILFFSFFFFFFFQKKRVGWREGLKLPRYTWNAKSNFL